MYATSEDEFRVNRVSSRSILRAGSNPIDFSFGDTMKQIPLTQGKSALVDDQDYEELSKYKWFAQRNGYTFYGVRTQRVVGETHTVAMHREILSTPKDMQTDHINGNGLDNRRSNLRICTRSQNAMNRRALRGLYKGMGWDKREGGWRTAIQVKGKLLYLGHYFCLVKAAKVYDIAARKYYGEFARVNFPRKGEQGI